MVRKLTFYEKASRLDVLKNTGIPDNGQIDELLDYLENDSLSKYFFLDLASKSWAPLLHNYDFFYSIPKSIEVESGMWRTPFWWPGEYLCRMAEEIPEIIIDVIQNVDTQNQRALNYLLESLLKIHPNKAKEVVEVVIKWFEKTNSELNTNIIIKLIAQLINGEEINSGILLLDALFTPEIPPRRSEDIYHKYFSSTVKFRNSRETVYISDFMVKEFPGLKEKALIDFIKVFENNLILAIVLERKARNDYSTISSSFWRNTIEDHEQNSTGIDIKELLLTGLRESILTLLEINPSEAKKITIRYWDSRHSILKRLALYLMQQSDKILNKEIKKILANTDNYDFTEIHHEFYWLSNKKFYLLHETKRNKIFNWVNNGPADKKRFEDYVEDMEGNKDENLEELINSWKARKLLPISEFIPNELKYITKRWIKKYGEPKYTDFTSWSTGVVDVKYKSPITSDQLNKLSVKEIVRIIAEFDPEKNRSFGERESIASSFEELFEISPKKFNEVLGELIVQDLGSKQAPAIFGTLDNLLRRSVKVNIDIVIRYSNYLLDIEDDTEGIYSLSIARFWEKTFEKSDNDLNSEQIKESLEIITKLLQHPDPSSENEITNEDFDPITNGLNSVRGVGFHALMNYCMFINEGKGKSERFISDNIISIFDNCLDLEFEKSYTIRSLFGQYLPHFQYLVPTWLGKNLNKIFTSRDKDYEYWLTAWLGYLYTPKLYTDLFKMLIPEYQKALHGMDKLNKKVKMARLSMKERLAEHLAIYYIFGEISLISRDELLALFFEKADDELRGVFVSKLGPSIGERGLKEESDEWEILWDFWNNRFEKIKKSKNRKGYIKEVSSFSDWLPNIPISFEKAYDNINFMVSIMENDFGIRKTLTYLSSKAEKSPLKAISIYYKIIQFPVQYWLSRDNQEVIITAAMNSGNQKAVEIGVKIINLFGERGDFYWKEYLPN